MRFTSITFRNFRILQSCKLELSQQASNFSFITGGSGKGKTTILEGIGWCLFERSTNGSELAPSSLLNFDAFHEAQHGDEIFVEVEIETIDQSGVENRILRTETFKKHHGEPMPIGSLLQMHSRRHAGLTWVEVEDPEFWIQSHFPIWQAPLCLVNSDFAGSLKPDLVRTVTELLAEMGLSESESLEARARIATGLMADFSSITGKGDLIRLHMNEEIDVELFGASQHQRPYGFLAATDRVSLDLAMSIAILREARSEVPLLLDGIFDRFDEQTIRRGLNFLHSVSEGEGGFPPRQVLVFSSPHLVNRLGGAPHEKAPVSIFTLEGVQNF